MKKSILLLILPIIVTFCSLVAILCAVFIKQENYQHFEAVMATCEKAGNIEYYYSQKYDKYYDKDKIEIDKSQVVLPAISHDYQFDRFEWSKNHETCKAVFVCSHDEKHISKQAVQVQKTHTDENSQSAEQTEYRVFLEFNNQVFEDNYVEFGKSKVVPMFSVQSGFYDEEFSLELSTSVPCQIYYTLDCSIPTKNSTLYQNAITISDCSSNPNVASAFQDISALSSVYFPNGLVDKCTVIRAIAVDQLGNISDVVEKTYFVNYNNKQGYSGLPIVSISMEYDDLFDYETGIYTTGKIYDEDDHSATYPEQIPANYNEKGKEWEREAVFTYFDDDKSYSFTQNIGIRIHGGWSRSFNQKSFNLYARSEYSGSDTFEQNFFGEGNLKTCMLRSGGYRDTYITKVRDNLNMDMCKDELFDTQSGYPCIVFLNGEYWGIYNLQERYSDNYVNEHYGIKKKNVIIVKNDEIDEGNEEDIELYNDLRTFFETNNFVDDAMYQQAGNYIDFEEFASYMCMQLYVGNIDWPGNNVRMWRSRTIGTHEKEDGKWHFMAYDTDDSSAILSYKCSANHNPFLNQAHWKWGPLDERSILGLMLSKLLQNQSFKALFLSTIDRMGLEVFASEKVNQYLDEKIELLGSNMQNFYVRFLSNNTGTYNAEYFESQIQIIKTFFAERFAYMQTFLADI